METWTGPDWSTFATRTFNFDSWTSECMRIVVHQFRKNCSCVFFDYLTIKMTSTSKRNQPNKSAWRCYSICLLFSNLKNKKQKQICHESGMEQEKGIRRICAFVKTLVELHLVSHSIVLTVSVQYIRVRVRVCAWQTVCLCGMYVCVCMYRHSISDLSTPLTQLSLGEERPLKILYCLPLVGYSNFSLF